MAEEANLAQTLRNKKGDRRGMPPRSRANLKPPQKPGDPPLNPGGKSGTPITAALRRMAERKLKTKFEPLTNADMIAQAALTAAMKLKVDSIKLIADRVDGVQTVKQELSGPDGGPIITTQVELTDDERRTLLNKLYDGVGARNGSGAADGTTD